MSKDATSGALTPRSDASQSVCVIDQCTSAKVVQISSKLFRNMWPDVSLSWSSFDQIAGGVD